MTKVKIDRCAATVASVVLALAWAAPAVAAVNDDALGSGAAASAGDRTDWLRLDRLAADDESWLCKYFPKYCASESDPGGLPGNTSGSGSGPDSGETRGMSTDAPEPPAASPAEPTTTTPAEPDTDKK
ncbi:MAG TPA: hypothetical protein VJ045_08925 [Hyphomicrobiaceae bacterium]|nr:hypothetical protein [Hyphomicrobiaceae bacterium]